MPIVHFYGPKEVGYILGMDVDIRYGTPVNSLGALLAEEWDAVFIGSGAPKGKELELPGRRESDRHTFLVSGPQLGYSYPTLLWELEVHGGGYSARGSSVAAAVRVPLTSGRRPARWRSPATRCDRRRPGCRARISA